VAGGHRCYEGGRWSALIHSSTDLAELRADLCNLCLLPGRRPPELVKADVKPAVYISVDGIVLVTDLLARQTLFQRLHKASSSDCLIS